MLSAILTDSYALDGAIVLFSGILILIVLTVVSLQKYYVKVGPDRAIVRSGRGGVEAVCG